MDLYPLDVPRLPVVSISQQRAMEEFWRRRQEEIEATVNFSERAIPMARLKKVICAEKGSSMMMMTFDLPAFLSKACELFVQELAIRAWLCAESHHRCTVLDSDIAEAIASTESYDFLVDILHAHPNPTRKRKRKRPRPAADQPSTYHYHPPHPHHHPHRHQIPRNIIPIPTPPMPTIFRQMPLSFPYPLSASTPPIANTVVDGNNYSRSVVTGATTTALAGPVGGLLNIPNIYLYMNMMSMTNAAAQQGDLSTTLPCPFNPPSPLQHPCPLPVANNNDPAIATAVELNHILFLPNGSAAETNTIHNASPTRTANNYGDNGVAAAIGRQQEQEKETTTDNDHQNVVHESVGADEEIEVFDESLLDKFLEEVQIDQDCLLPPDTTSADFLSFINTIPDMEEWINDPYLLDDVFSNPSTSSR